MTTFYYSSKDFPSRSSGVGLAACFALTEMDYLDMIVLIVAVLVLLLVLYYEGRHYTCDQLTCDSYGWAKKHSSNDEQLAEELLRGFYNNPLWMRAFMLAVIIALVTSWWLEFRIRVRDFVAILIFTFLICYFGLSYFQHHYYRPIVEEVIRIMRANRQSDTTAPTTST
jgi:hypothetical protein